MNNYKLEKYLDRHEGKEISICIYKKYETFGYENIWLFAIDLDFMLEHIYNIKIRKCKKKEMSYFGGSCGDFSKFEIS